MRTHHHRLPGYSHRASKLLDGRPVHHLAGVFPTILSFKGKKKKNTQKNSLHPGGFPEENLQSPVCHQKLGDPKTPPFVLTAEN